MADDGVRRLAVILGADLRTTAALNLMWTRSGVRLSLDSCLRTATRRSIQSSAWYRRAKSFAHEIRSEVRKGTEAFEKILGSFARYDGRSRSAAE